MKCPYRKHIYIFRDSKGVSGSQTEYEECYKDECPFYIPEQSWKNGLLLRAGCSRKEGDEK